MGFFLGIDTSNYTTSAAIYNSDSGKMLRKKQLLPVKDGECGLRQSDAVFHHVRQLPDIIDELMQSFDGSITAVGASSRPRDVEGSYMPCFTVGHGTARILADMLHVPLYTFSHQRGHIAAALYSAEKTELIGQRFLAFHVSGGTTEAVIVGYDDETVFTAELVAKTLDLNAGQLVDRTGVMLGLPFPSGMQLEKLALGNTEKLNPRISLKGFDCCLSGVQNICEKAHRDGRSPEYISALCLAYIEKTLTAMCDRLLEHYGNMPVVFAGGVMSNSIIRRSLSGRYGAFFAQPEFSSDNACGTALLCSIKHRLKNNEIIIRKGE